MMQLDFEIGPFAGWLSDPLLCCIWRDAGTAGTVEAIVVSTFHIEQIGWSDEESFQKKKGKGRSWGQGAVAMASFIVDGVVAWFDENTGCDT
jgi:hypothetical protein